MQEKVITNKQNKYKIIFGGQLYYVLTLNDSWKYRKGFAIFFRWIRIANPILTRKDRHTFRGPSIQKSQRS